MQLKPNSGFIFKNSGKDKETHPDYRGTINVDGKDFEISLWVKEGKKGKFFSASIKPPYVKTSTQEKTFVQSKEDENLPF